MIKGYNRPLYIINHDHSEEVFPKKAFVGNFMNRDKGIMTSA